MYIEINYKTIILFLIGLVALILLMIGLTKNNTSEHMTTLNNVDYEALESLSSMYTNGTMTLTNLNVTNSVNIGNTLTASGNITTNGTMTLTDLNVTNSVNIGNTLTASGNITTNNNLIGKWMTPSAVNNTGGVGSDINGNIKFFGGDSTNSWNIFDNNGGTLFSVQNQGGTTIKGGPLNIPHHINMCDGNNCAILNTIVNDPYDGTGHGTKFYLSFNDSNIGPNNYRWTADGYHNDKQGGTSLS